MFGFGAVSVPLGVVCDGCAGGVHEHDWIVLTAGFQDGACHYVSLVEVTGFGGDGPVVGESAVACSCGVR